MDIVDVKVKVEPEQYYTNISSVAISHPREYVGQQNSIPEKTEDHVEVKVEVEDDKPEDYQSDALYEMYHTEDNLEHLEEGFVSDENKKIEENELTNNEGTEHAIDTNVENGDLTESNKTSPKIQKIKGKKKGGMCKKDINHACDICKKAFTCKKSLKRHMPVHTKEKPFKCDICAKSFPRRSSLNTHIHTHFNDRRFSCEECSQRFHQKIGLQRHMLIHSGQKPFECEYCLKKFSTKGSLDIHVVTHTNEGKFRCSRCSKSFHIEAQLKRHMISHSSLKAFSCEVCSKEFSFQSSLKDHMTVHSGNRSFLCDTCGTSFARVADLQRHLLTHSGEKPFECFICKERFGLKGTLDNHLFVHSDKGSTGTEHDTGGKLLGYEHNEFLKNQSMDSYLSEIHVVRDETLKQTDVFTSSENAGNSSFQCDNRIVSDGTVCCNLDVHRSHIIDKGKSTGGNDCGTGEGYSSRESSAGYICTKDDNLTLKNKKLLKIGENYFLNGAPFTKKVYPCQICNKIFRRKGDLQIHDRKHSGLRPFECQICQKMFKSKSNLSKHLEVHSGVKRFHCTECEKMFSTLSNLQSHQITHSGQKEFECHICLKHFSLKGNLTKHIKKHDMG